MNDKIDCVEVLLEEPDKNLGVKRLSSVISYDSKGNKLLDYQNLIDNTEFNYSDGNDVREEIKELIASRVGVDIEKINMMN